MKSTQEFPDVRYRPIYTLIDVARYSRVPVDRLRDWSNRGEGQLLVPSDLRSRSPFSFLNLVEAHVLAGLRRENKLSLRAIRTAMEWISTEFNTKHPLAEIDLETDGREVFIRAEHSPVSASARGQFAFGPIMDLYLRRIERDSKHLPIRFFPMTRDESPKDVVIDPTISFGRPVIQGTRISTAMIFERYEGGEGVSEIANDYDLQVEKIEEALRCEITQRRAA